MIESEIAQLNKRFGIADEVMVVRGPGGLPMVDIVNSFSHARVALQGAQILTFQPINTQPVLWLSKNANYEIGKAIRGGIPICWPWFGGHPTDPKKPAHGFARITLWNLFATQSEQDGSTSIRFFLEHDSKTQSQWPFKFRIEMWMNIARDLTLDFLVRNIGSQKFSFSAALHSYFTVKEVSEIAIHGFNGCSFLDLLEPNKIKKQSGPVRIYSETDRIYLDSEGNYSISDPGFKRIVTISKKGSTSMVIWNPWIAKSARMKDFGNLEYKEMVCVETTNAEKDSVALRPEEEHHLITRIGVKQNP